MSDRFECDIEDDLGQCFRVVAKPVDGAAHLYVEYRHDRHAHESHAIALKLPAADARRLRDWLRERYPEETTNG